MRENCKLLMINNIRFFALPIPAISAHSAATCPQGTKNAILSGLKAFTARYGAFWLIPPHGRGRVRPGPSAPVPVRSELQLAFGAPRAVGLNACVGNRFPPPCRRLSSPRSQPMPGRNSWRNDLVELSPHMAMIFGRKREDGRKGDDKRDMIETAWISSAAKSCQAMGLNHLRGHSTWRQ